MTQAILTLNAGSSSIKFGLFRAKTGEPIQTASGKIEGIGITPHLIAKDAAGTVLTEHRWHTNPGLSHEAFLNDLLIWAESHLHGDELIGVGHRVVHGGLDYSRPVRISPAHITALEKLCPLAPLHQPHNLAAMRAVAAARPQLPQVACFDTAFHHDLPAVASRFAIPRNLEIEGIRRYGFHGLSYEYISRKLEKIDTKLAAARVIVAHLGNGASLCAMQAGRSVDTTMGFTALEGLMMGTRCGAIDPGVLLYLLEQKGMTAGALAHLLYNESGLLGISGISSDMRVLLESTDARAAEAIDLFCYRIARESGALATSLGGIDGLIFTAGIGENAPAIRSQICQRMAWLGVDLDEDANRLNRPVISSPGSRVVVRIVPTDEESMIAIHTLKLLKAL